MKIFEVITFKMQAHLMLHLYLFCLGYFSLLTDAESICDANPCKNGATCLLNNDEVTCFCQEPYEGPFCNEVPCGSMSCLNGGKCKVVDELSQEVSCDCPDEYTGDQCEQHLCLDHHCENGGRCSVIDGRATCTCQEPDEKCDIDPCNPNPCKNSGTCVPYDDDDVVCLCQELYIGKYCAETSCDSNPCQNGGTCNVIGEFKFSCNCPAEYIGERCELHLCSLHHCEHGGTCNVRNGNANCDCKDPFQGEKCQKEVLKKQSTPSITTTSTPKTTALKTEITKTSFPKNVIKSTISTGMSSYTSYTNDQENLTNGSTLDEEIVSHSSIKSTLITSVITMSNTSTVEAITDESPKINTVTPTSGTHIEYTSATNTLFETNSESTFEITSKISPDIEATTVPSTKLDIASITGSTSIGYTSITGTLSKGSTGSTFEGTSNIRPIIEATTDPPTELHIITATNGISVGYTSATNTFDKNSAGNTFKSTSKIIPSENSQDIPDITSKIYEMTTKMSTEIHKSTIITEFESTIETSTGDINGTNEENSPTKNVTNYIVIAVSIFAAVVAIAVSGWFIKRQCQKRTQHQYFRGNLISEISGNETLA